MIISSHNVKFTRWRGLQVICSGKLLLVLFTPKRNRDLIGCPPPRQLLYATPPFDLIVFLVLLVLLVFFVLLAPIFNVTVVSASSLFVPSFRVIHPPTNPIL